MPDAAVPPAAGSLTPREQALLPFLYQLHGARGASPAGNLVFAVALRGDVDPVRLRDAMARICAESPELRSYYAPAGVPPACHCQAAGDIPLDIVDCRGDSRSFKRILRQAIAHQFDLSAYPLFRVVLAQRTVRRHVFLLVAHHMLMDGWSVVLFLRRLSRYYATPAAAQPPSPGNWDRTRFVAHAAAFRASPAYSQARDAMTEWLRPAIPVLQPQTPFMFPAPGEQHRLIHLDAATAAQARRNLDLSVTGFHRLLFVMLIRWLTGAAHIGLSQSDPNRPQQALNLYGFVSDDLLLRISPEADDTPASLSGRIAEAESFARQHQGVPAANILQNLYGLRGLPRFHFNPFSVGANALRLKGTQAMHFKAMRAYALAQVNFISLDARHVFLALSEARVEGCDLRDMAEALHHFVAALAVKPDELLASLMAFGRRRLETRLAEA